MPTVHALADYDIRNTEDRDLDGVRELLELVFRTPHPPEYVRWLLADPWQPGRFASLVATCDGRIVGHVGYVRADYTAGDEHLTGTHAVHLAVHPDHRGVIGRELFRQASDLGDISVIYEGTPSAVRLYPKVGFTRHGHAFFFRSSLRLPRLRELFARSGARGAGRVLRRSVLDRIRRAHRQPDSDRSVSIAPYAGDATARSLDESVTNAPSREALAWFRQCPDLDSQVHTVHRDGLQAGVLFLYVRRDRGRVAGRIHHLPDMGPDPATWARVLDFAEDRLREAECGTITICATHPALRQSLATRGYRLQSRRAIWIRDPAGRVRDRSWHLTYLEGDHGFRSIG